MFGGTPPRTRNMSYNPKTPFDEGVRTYERSTGVALVAGWQTQRMVACPLPA
jgi:hypothetical protein